MPLGTASLSVASSAVTGAVRWKQYRVGIARLNVIGGPRIAFDRALTAKPTDCGGRSHLCCTLTVVATVVRPTRCPTRLAP